MKKKLVVTLLGVMCCAMLYGCGGDNNNNANQDPLTGEEMTTEMTTENAPLDNQAGAMDEFDQLLGQDTTDATGIIDYINTNIGTAAEADVSRFFTGLFNFGDDIRNIDFTKLEPSRQYMSEDMIAFSELMKLEADSPSMVMSDEENRREIGLTLSEMLERALLFENHIDKYPNGVSTEAATRLYEEIATHAITGGYDKTAGVEHYYKGETPDVVDQQALQYYQQFAEANPDTRLGQIVQEYITLLQENNFQINDELENFYRGLDQRLVPATTDTTQMNGDNGMNGSQVEGSIISETVAEDMTQENMTGQDNTANTRTMNR